MTIFILGESYELSGKSFSKNHLMNAYLIILDINGLIYERKLNISRLILQ